VICGADAVAVPLSEIFEGAPGALWLIAIDALFVPVLVGLNVALIAQLPPTATLVQLFVCANWPASVPAKTTLLTVSGPVPVFLSVTDLEALTVPTS
jgi:hypothetical protein